MADTTRPLSIDSQWLEEKLGRIMDRVEFLCSHVQSSDENLTRCKTQCTSSLEELFRRVGSIETTQAINDAWIKDQKEARHTREHTQASWWHTYGVWATLGLMVFAMILGMLMGGKAHESPSPHHPPQIQRQSDTIIRPGNTARSMPLVSQENAK